MLVVWLWLGLLPAMSQTGWSWSVHPEAGFKVLTPVPLTHQVREVPTESDVIQFHQYHGGSVTDSVASLAFVVDHYVLPEPPPVGDDTYIKDFFENTIDELLTSLNGTQVYMDILHQPGREVCIWKGSYDQGRGMIRANCILEGDRYYGLQVFGLEKNKPEAMMTRFLDSFRTLTASNP